MLIGTLGWVLKSSGMGDDQRELMNILYMDLYIPGVEGEDNIMR